MKLQNLAHILMGIICIGLLSGAQAVVPPPDGGYPNFTTAEGTKGPSESHQRRRKHRSWLVFAVHGHLRQLQHRCWRWKFLC